MGVDVQIPGFDYVVEVGRGGFAVVFRAWQVGVDREVALKVLTVRPGSDVTEAFRSECVAFGALSGHPNIVTVHDVGQSADGRPFIVMEYLHRGSLADVVRAGGPLPWTEAAEMGVEVAGALETAHRAGFLHRDVKPENVVISRFGQAKLGDFGIAVLHDRLDGITGTTSFVGSVRHAAPEVLDRRRPTVASDVYSLGSTIFTALAGRPPFGSGADADIEGLRARIATHRVPDLRGRGVPDAVCRVVEQALAKNPADRQSSAEEFGRQLQDALAGEAGSPVRTLSVEKTARRPASRRVRRRRALVAAVGAVALVAGGVLVATSLRRESGQDRGGGAPPSTVGTTAPTTAPAPPSTVPPTTVPPPRPGALTDDFSRSGGPPWARSGPAEARFIQQYVDGRYRLAIQNMPEGVPIVVPPSYAPISGSPAHSVRIEVDATKASEARADFGVICGGASSQLPYGGLVDTGGWWRIVRTSDRGLNEEVRAGRDASVLVGPGPHRIGVECVAEGDVVSIALTVDGVRLGTATGRRGPSFGPGPGLLVGGLGGPVDVLFDNVALTYS